MRTDRTPDVRPGAASNDNHDLVEMNTAIAAANRVLRACYHARPVNRARPWESQLELTARFEWKTTGLAPCFGCLATVVFYYPDDEPFEMTKWGATWDEAVEDLVYEVLTL